MNILQLLVIGLIFFLASMLQGAVGFAFALLVIPVLVWTGISLSEAVAMVAVTGAVQLLVAAYQLRFDVRWREVGLATIVRYVTLPLGILLLVYIDNLDRTQMKQILGAIVLLAVASQMFWPVQPRERLHPAWAGLAFSASGLMNGLAGIGGPPLVLWVMAHRWSNREIRAFLQTTFLLATPLQITLLYTMTRHNPGAAMAYGLLFTPVVAVGSLAGVRLGNRINRGRLRQAAYGILVITALVSMAAPAFG